MRCATMSDDVKRIQDPETGKQGAYRVLDDATVVILNPSTLEEVMRIVTRGDEVRVEKVPTAEEMLFSAFFKEWDKDGAVGRCVKGCIQQGRGAECVAACGITNGGQGWLDF